MSTQTIIKCDKCGATQTQPEQISGVGPQILWSKVNIRVFVTEANSNNTKDMDYDLCPACAERLYDSMLRGDK